MQQAIIGYHQDDENHWVAQLACGHNQHVRHNPPWVLRPWVTHIEGRDEHLGLLLNCVKCDQQAPSDERPAPLNPFTTLFPANTLALARVLGRLLQANQAAVSCAESCTGGLIAAAITEIPGSSEWFTHSWVTYSNAAKQQQLGVSSDALAHGAVSQATVEAMAQGAQANSSALCALATSGIAGPGGGTAQKPVGTVWIAWSGPWGINSQCFYFSGDRHQVRLQAVNAALGQLIALLKA
ncbi:MAG TPA: nicotinamide-nucleotide amidohydrolase family protein [Cellvibrionaceae bacterium]|nr:nicotinamide-nucleotide amidohydrolase family protein [Cellvibrionaceae bacterium]HMY38514.1 nicotinamide-nucleotide amidohydrolase family protein [Marinagarivorans sp.]HNG60242.1 nicotinamide-nucleotide amidohydrolase family protein [Cellvibrionaceae bacterium]